MTLELSTRDADTSARLEPRHLGQPHESSVLALANIGHNAIRRARGTFAGHQHVQHSGRPADRVRNAAESQMEKLARGLPAAGWVKSVRGAGLLGLATIVAEAGDLSNFPNPAKLW